jgi:hypothetical protein
MSLILAIEPDRRQSLTLTTLSRARLNVELVLGETVNRALDKLGSRRPDLVLTSPALSQRDEATLASRLRAIEAGGTPVPRMVIPPLGPPPPEKKTSTLGRPKAPHGPKAPAHCDPLMFSEQIADCLELAAAERAALAAAQAEFEAAWAAEVSPRQTRPVPLSTAPPHADPPAIKRGTPAAPEPEEPLACVDLEPAADEAPVASRCLPAADRSAPTDAGGDWEEVSLDADAPEDPATAPPSGLDEPAIVDVELGTLERDLVAASVSPDSVPASEAPALGVDDATSREPAHAAVIEAYATTDDVAVAAVTADGVAGDVAAQTVVGEDVVPDDTVALTGVSEQEAVQDVAAIVEDVAAVVQGVAAVIQGVAAEDSAAENAAQAAAADLAAAVHADASNDAAPLIDAAASSDIEADTAAETVVGEWALAGQADRSAEPSQASADPEETTLAIEVDAAETEPGEPVARLEPETPVNIAVGREVPANGLAATAQWPRTDHRRPREAGASSIGPTPGWHDVLSAIRRDIQQLRGDEPAGRPRSTPARADQPVTPAASQPAPALYPRAVESPAAITTPPVTPVAESAEASVRLAGADERRDADDHEGGRCGDSVDPMPWRPRLNRPIGRVVPVQDEWGFFDPQQCGFEALRAKLLEMIEANRPDKPRPA